jgi:hypothetical protein
VLTVFDDRDAQGSYTCWAEQRIVMLYDREPLCQAI